MAEVGGNRLWRDFEALCDCGGRLSGTESERRACELLVGLGREATGVDCRVMSVPYLSWRAGRCELRGPDGALLPSHPLVRSAATPADGIEAEVLDLGRGTPEEFAAHASDIPGRIVLVRHELMFAAGTIHRRLKYRAAVDAGAAGVREPKDQFYGDRTAMFVDPFGHSWNVQHTVERLSKRLGPL